MMKTSKYPINSKIDTLNISAIQSLDTKIKQVLGRVSQVMHYEFNYEAKTWDNSDIKGALFIYERSTDPKYAFIILNTQNMGKDLKVTMERDMQFQLFYPLLMYRSLNSGICALYIHSKPDFYKTGELFSELVNSMCPDGQQDVLTMPEHDIIASSLLENNGAQPGAGAKDVTGSASATSGPAGLLDIGRNSCRIQNLDASLLSSPHMMSDLYDEEEDEEPLLEPKGVDIMAMLSKAHTEYQAKLDNPESKGKLNQYLYNPKKTSQNKTKPHNDFSENIQKKFSIFDNISDSKINSANLTKSTKNKSDALLSENVNKINENEPMTSPTSKKLFSPDMFESDSNTEEKEFVLSKAQLQHTLIDLMTNDDEFITKIHNSYMNSVAKKM